MGRISKEEEAKRNYKITQLVSEGYDHRQIGKQVNMRPQNVLACKAYKIATGTWEGDLDLLIVSPTDQREMLDEVTAMIIDDLARIDKVIGMLERADSVLNAPEIRRLFALRKEFYHELGNMWSIAQTIAGGGGPTKAIGDKTQINIGQIDYQKVQQASEKAATVLDKARLDGHIRENS